MSNTCLSFSFVHLFFVFYLCLGFVFYLGKGISKCFTCKPKTKYKQLINLSCTFCIVPGSDPIDIFVTLIYTIFDRGLYKIPSLECNVLSVEMHAISLYVHFVAGTPITINIKLLFAVKCIVGYIISLYIYHVVMVQYLFSSFFY